jgi:hypothetical protein
MLSFEAHGSVLAGNPPGHRRLVEMQKIEVAKDGRRIRLLHNAAAAAAGVFPFSFAAYFNQNRATAPRIGAMPAFSGLHHHGPFPPFARTTGIFAKAISGWTVINGRRM